MGRQVILGSLGSVEPMLEYAKTLAQARKRLKLGYPMQKPIVPAVQRSWHSYNIERFDTTIGGLE